MPLPCVRRAALALALTSAAALAGGSDGPPGRIAFEPLGERAMFTDCASPQDPGPCRVRRPWTLAALRARAAREGMGVWRDGNELTFTTDGVAGQMQLCCGLQGPLSRLTGTNTWVLTVRVPNAARAVLSYGFAPLSNGQLVGAFSTRVWRGPLAPEALPTGVVGGEVRAYTLRSEALGERALSVYLPPGFIPKATYPVVYAADGQMVPELAAVLDPQIRAGELPGVLVVGVDAVLGPPGAPGDDGRAQEYLVGINAARFAQHEAFFTREVRAWAEQTLSASTNPRERAVFGVSNGAAFAVTMGLRHPDLYGTVLAFSFGWREAAETLDSSRAPRFYLEAGSYEPPFLDGTRALATRLAGAGVAKVFRERVGGHDSALWHEEFPRAVAWAFGGR